MITLENVTKAFDHIQAVKDVSLNVQPGETLVLLGASGSGKTTTLKMINRLIDPDSGKVYIDGQEIGRLAPEEIRRRIGYVMQNTGLFPHYTNEQNISVVPRLLKWNSEKIRSRIEVIIGKLKLEPDVLKLFPHQLSGGQQQRVGLARALVANPSILLMDEPFGSLDNLTRSAIQVEFMQLDELRRKTIVMVTHDINEAFMLADRICLIDRGEVIQTGLPKELLMNPINDFVRQFFDGDRLALEFRMVSLNDVWGFLPTATVSQIQEHTDKLHPALSIWSAMEIIRSSSSNHQRFVVSDVEKKDTKMLDFQKLTIAFHRYKQKF